MINVAAPARARCPERIEQERIEELQQLDTPTAAPTASMLDMLPSACMLAMLQDEHTQYRDAGYPASLRLTACATHTQK